MKAIAALLLLATALPAHAQDGRSLLEQRRNSRLLELRPQVEEPRLRRLDLQSRARQKEWEGATAPEYRRRLERDVPAAANAWRRTEAERFDAGEASRN